MIKKVLTKIFLALVLTVSSAMLPISMKVSAAENPYFSTWAWPGRPGGNGDGSEEWLQGNYGETNGPYRLIYSSQGDVNFLNNQKNVADTIGTGILGVLVGQVFVGATIAALSGVGLTAMGIAASISGGYQGAYYKSNTYISGRCMKTVITTYKNANYTGFVKEYIQYTKW